MKHARLLVVLSILACSTLLSASNPVPLIYQPLIPASVAPGYSVFTLTVRGTIFVPGAVVKVNGTALATTFVNGSTLQAAVPANVVAEPTTLTVTVDNPGSIDSNVIYLPVRNPSKSVAVKLDPISPSAMFPGAIAIGDFNKDGTTMAISGYRAFWGTVMEPSRQGRFRNSAPQLFALLARVSLCSATSMATEKSTPPLLAHLRSLLWEGTRHRPSFCRCFSRKPALWPRN